MSRILFRAIIVAAPTVITWKYVNNRVHSNNVHKFSPFQSLKGQCESLIYNKNNIADDSSCRIFSNKLPTKIPMRITYRQNKHTSYKCFKNFIANEELWSIRNGSNIIHTFSLSGHLLKSFSLPNVLVCRAIIKLTSKNLLTCGSGGLFMINRNNDSTRLMLGDFSDMSLVGTTLYVLDWRLGRVDAMLLNSNGQTIEHKKGVTIGKAYVPSEYNSIQATDKWLYIGQYKDNSILKLPITDNKLGSCYKVQSFTRNLKGPIICGVDKEGTLLIADEFNHRLRTSSENEEWGSIDFKFDQPADAFIYKGLLFVETGSGLVVHNTQ